jgi:hypothetical protein
VILEYSTVHFRTVNPNLGHPAIPPNLDRAALNADSAPEFGLQNATLNHPEIFV